MRASADSLTHNLKKRFRSSARPCATPEITTPLDVFTSNWTFVGKKTTCSSSLFEPSQKAFAASTEFQTLAGCPPAAPPLPLYECSWFGTSFPLDTCELKKQEAPSLLCKFPTDQSYLPAATTMKTHCGPEMPPLNPLSPVLTAHCGLEIHGRAHLWSNALRSPVHRDGRQVLS